MAIADLLSIYLIALVLSHVAKSTNAFSSHGWSVSFSTTQLPSLRQSGLGDRVSKMDGNEYMSISKIEEYAGICGLRLQVTSTGPYLRIEAFPTSNSLMSPNAHAQPIGFLTAFIRPIPPLLFHLDTIQVQNRRQSLSFSREGWTSDGPGISFIMGSYALLWAYQRGCRKTELLAVNDSDQMNRILVRLYKSFGFSTVREVGDDFASVPDRLIWGAKGTLMEMNITSFLQEWSGVKLEILIEAAKRKRNEQEVGMRTVGDNGK